MALGPISGDPRNLQVVATIFLIRILARSILGTKRPALPFPASRGLPFPEVKGLRSSPQGKHWHPRADWL